MKENKQTARQKGKMALQWHDQVADFLEILQPDLGQKNFLNSFRHSSFSAGHCSFLCEN